jgi:hypothetical protein
VSLMYCDPPATVAIVQPADKNPGLGSIVVLTSGAWFEVKSLYVGDPNALFVLKLRQTDHIQICFGPETTWVDPNLSGFRPSIINDSDSASYIYAPACSLKFIARKSIACSN